GPDGSQSNRDPSGLDFTCQEVCVSSEGFPSPPPGKKPPSGGGEGQCQERHWVCVEKGGTGDDPRIFNPVDEPDLFPPQPARNVVYERSKKAEDAAHKIGCGFLDVMMAHAIGAMGEVAERSAVATGALWSA